MAQTAEYLRRWKVSNPEKLAGYEALRRSSGRKSESDKRAYLKNRAKKLAYRKEYYSKNKEKAIADSRAYYANNKSLALSKQKARYSKVKDTPEFRLQTYKAGARVRGIKFLLTLEQFMSFWQQPCYYCGEPIETVGIDRLDNSSSYVVGNVVSCCSGCNYSKNDEHLDSFISRCCRIAAKHGDNRVK